MIEVTYVIKGYVNVKEVATMADWSLFNKAVYHGQAIITSTRHIGGAA